MKAWYLDQPSKVVTLDKLRTIGIHYWYIPDRHDGKLEALCKERNYKNRDEVVISPEKIPNFEEKLAIFYTEHLHEDEEIRYAIDGSGYFDVRDEKDQWIRIHFVKGDLLILPAGIYHRFTVDEKKYAHAMRIFREEPKWTPYNRTEATTDGRGSRAEWKATVEKESAKPADPNGQAYVLPENAKALAHYPHARAVNGFFYVSGLSSRNKDNTFAGVTHNADGTVKLDIAEQTRGCLNNLRRILAEVKADLSHVVDMTVFLVDMKDYQGMNAVYNEHFSAESGPTRTTVAVHQLPHPHLVIEIKAVAVLPK